MHWLQRLCDRCPGLRNSWLAGCVSMWLRSVDASPSCIVTRGLGAAHAVACLRKSSCWVKLELVCSWCHLLRCRLVLSAS